ncbi:hypothetical protein CYMTET_32935 [Cymbomonas tetramitiformis]|uniref:Cadherin-like beta-sandwich-like domain-containing protein n=1 Tax=Cymbomonas tetramitiformis TaxID=36881 RepID=A0AAE0FEB4_9CHLO|nr:hypothetical protein CYMTET_32935 [Cymbomonas tetramitiformis]
MEVESSVSLVQVKAVIKDAESTLKIGILDPFSKQTVANDTASQSLGLSQGKNTTVRIEVDSVAYPNSVLVTTYGNGDICSDSFCEFADAARTISTYRIFNLLHIFRRTLSNSSTLDSLMVTSTASSGGLSPTLSANTTVYNISVPYSVSNVTVTATLPNTAAPISQFDNEPRGTIKIGSTAVSVANASALIQLPAGASTTTLLVTAEDTTTRAYTLHFFRTIPRTSSSLLDLRLPAGLELVPFDSDVGTYSAVLGFQPNITEYGVQGSTVYPYLQSSPHYGVVVEPSVAALSLTPVAAADLRLTILIGGQAVASNATAPAQDLASSSWPNPSLTTISIVCIAEDGTATTTYTLTVTRAGQPPEGASWVPYYGLEGGISDPEREELLAGSSVNFSLVVDKAQWDADFPLAAGDRTSITGMLFEPQVAIDGAAEGVPVLNLTEGWGSCSEGVCVGHVCVPGTSPFMDASPPPLPPKPPPPSPSPPTTSNATSFPPLPSPPPPLPPPPLPSPPPPVLSASEGTLYGPCSKDTLLPYTPTRVGDYVYQVQAYGSLVGDRTVSFAVVHARMTLNASVVEVQDVRAGSQTLLVTGHDRFGNLVTGADERSYAASELEAITCPEKLSDPTPASEAPPGWVYVPSAEAYAPPFWDSVCRCGPATGCVTQNEAHRIARNGDGTYTIQFSEVSTGAMEAYISGEYGGYVRFRGGSDLLSEYPVRLVISGGMITRNSYATGFGTVTWVVGQAPASFTVVARDAYANEITSGGEAGALSVRTDPLTVSEVGQSPGPIVISDQNDGTYIISIYTVIAAMYLVEVDVNGDALLESPYSVTVTADQLATATVQYPESGRAGERTVFTLQPSDTYGNVLEYEDFSASFHVRVWAPAGVELGAGYLDEEFSKTGVGQYQGSFVAPTNTAVDAEMQVLLTDSRYDLSMSLAEGSDPPQRLDITHSTVNERTSEFFLETEQRAGHLQLGVRPVDGFGNACDEETPSAVQLTATNATTTVYGVARAEQYGGRTGTETVEAAGATVPGQYTVEVLIQGQVVQVEGVSGAEVTVVPNVISAMSTVSALPEVLAVGNTASVLISARDAYGNVITQGGEAARIVARIAAVGDPADRVAGTVQDLGGGEYVLELVPGKSGEYVLELLFGGELHTSAQHFTAQLTEARPGWFVVSGTGIEGGQAGESLVVEIAATGGAAQVGALALDFQLAVHLPPTPGGEPESQEVVAAASGGRFYVMYSRTMAGTYVLRVEQDGEPLGGSPYNIAVSGGMPVTSWAAWGAEGGVWTAGQETVLWVDVRDAYGNAAGVEEGIDLVVQLRQVPDGEVLWADVLPADTAQAETAAAATAAANNRTASYPATFRASAWLSAAGAYDVQVTLLGEAVCSMYCSSTRCTPRSSTTGTDCIPLAVLRAGPADAEASLLQGSGSNDFEAGAEVSLQVIPLDALGNALPSSMSSELAYAATLTCVTSLNPTLQVGSMPIADMTLVYEPADGSHRATYTLTTAGQYSAVVLAAGTEDNGPVTGKPRNVTVLPIAAVLESTVLTPPSPRATAGEDSALQVELRDAHGNRVVQDLSSVMTVELVAARSTEDVPQSGVDAAAAVAGAAPVQGADGLYSVNFSTAVAGAYRARIGLLGDFASTEGWEVTVQPGPVAAETSAVSGAGLRGALVGAPAAFEVLGMDIYGNALERQEGAWHAEAAVLTAGADGGVISRALDDSELQQAWSATTASYLVNYTVKTAGQLQVLVWLGETALRGSPFMVVVVPGPTAASACLLSGGGLNGGLVTWEDRDTNITLQARDAYSNPRGQGGDGFLVEGSAGAAASTAGGALSVHVAHQGEGEGRVLQAEIEGRRLDAWGARRTAGIEGEAGCMGARRKAEIEEEQVKAEIEGGGWMAGARRKAEIEGGGRGCMGRKASACI